MKYHYIEGEWVNSLLNAFSSIGLDINKLSKGIAEIHLGRVKIGQRIEVGVVRNIWHLADRVAQDPLLGITVGKLHNYKALGVLAPVLWHSPSIREAIYNIQKFQTLISESGQYHIEEVSRQGVPCLYCEYIAVDSCVPTNDHQVLAVIVKTLAVLKAIADEPLNILHIQVPASLNRQLLEEKLGVNVQCNKDHFAICIAKETIDIPLLGIDKRLYQLNLSYAEELLRVKSESISLINSVKKLIIQGHYSLATIEYVDAELRLNKRTLQRILTEYGTSFRQLKEEVLKETSTNLLLQNEMATEEIANYLGYSEPSAFYRAFKTWYKMTPKQFYKVRLY